MQKYRDANCRTEDLARDLELLKREYEIEEATIRELRGRLNLAQMQQKAVGKKQGYTQRQFLDRVKVFSQEIKSCNSMAPEAGMELAINIMNTFEDKNQLIIAPKETMREAEEQYDKTDLLEKRIDELSRSLHTKEMELEEVLQMVTRLNSERMTETESFKLEAKAETEAVAKYYEMNVVYVLNDAIKNLEDMLSSKENDYKEATDRIAILKRENEQFQDESHNHEHTEKIEALESDYRTKPDLKEQKISSLMYEIDELKASKKKKLIGEMVSAETYCDEDVVSMLEDKVKHMEMTLQLKDKHFT
mmetsp:Transcript_54227/g.65404  ORF Transcript_54227/g.65404 Transcript_54227/m.65404 type:complete len:305 (+) Transcript_54227:213-1127(+)